MSFFDLPPTAIDSTALDAFLSERLPESINLEYKRELTSSVYETIAAMANTYGGTILVGVDEDTSFDPPRPVLPACGVKPGTQEALVNTAYTLIQPAFSFDAVPVTADGGGQVIVIRVDLVRVSRPVVLTRRDSHRIKIRLEARNADADRYRMAALFNEPPGVASAIAEPSNLNLGTTAHVPVDDLTRPAFAVRIATEVAMPYERLDRAFIETPMRDLLDKALAEASLTAWLSGQTVRDVRSWGEWAPSDMPYTSHSGLAIRRWRGQYDLGGGAGLQIPVGGQVCLQVPSGSYPSYGRLTLLVDATFEPEPVLEAIRAGTTSTRLEHYFREKLTLQGLYELLLAMIETSLKTIPDVVFESILGVPSGSESARPRTSTRIRDR